MSPSASRAKIGERDLAAPRILLLRRDGENTLAKKGHGYGSEWHFEHYRTVLPERLDQQLKGSIGRAGAPIPGTHPGDSAKEPRGLEFLKPDPKTLEAWRAFWPQTGNPPNWDGVARDATTDEWLLFEAKANHPEFCS